jgi:antitoxin component of RelBE/YafQ-DinJ toxin-antitoxin module
MTKVEKIKSKVRIKREVILNARITDSMAEAINNYCLTHEMTWSDVARLALTRLIASEEKASS